VKFDPPRRRVTGKGAASMRGGAHVFSSFYRSRTTLTRTIRLLAVLMLLCGPVLAEAQDPDEPTELAEQDAYLGIRPSYQSCIDQSDGSMPSMTRCAESEFAYQDKRLNAAYVRLMKSTSAEQREKLRTEERAWIAKKDSECAVPDAPGQGQILDSLGCRITATARRSRQLER
jgi:uncharacterized protein YecT (DUF1311 family)